MVATLVELCTKAIAKGLHSRDLAYVADIPPAFRTVILTQVDSPLSSSDVQQARQRAAALSSDAALTADLQLQLSRLAQSRFTSDLLTEIATMTIDDFDRSFLKATQRHRDLLILLLCLGCCNPNEISSLGPSSECRRRLKEFLFPYTKPPPFIKTELTTMLQQHTTPLSDAHAHNVDRLVQAAVENDIEVFTEFQSGREGRKELTQNLCGVFALTPPKSCSPKQRAFAISRFLRDWCHDGVPLAQARGAAFVTTPTAFTAGSKDCIRNLFVTSASELTPKQLDALVVMARLARSSCNADELRQLLLDDSTKESTIQLLHRGAKLKYAEAQKDPTRMFTRAATLHAWDQCAPLDNELLRQYGLDAGKMFVLFRVDRCGAVVSTHASRGAPTGTQADHWFPYAFGGATTRDNVAMLHWRANRTKGDEIPQFLDPKTLQPLNDNGWYDPHMFMIVLRRYGVWTMLGKTSDCVKDLILLSACQAIERALAFPPPLAFHVSKLEVLKCTLSSLRSVRPWEMMNVYDLCAAVDVMLSHQQHLCILCDDVGMVAVAMCNAMYMKCDRLLVEARGAAHREQLRVLLTAEVDCAQMEIVERKALPLSLCSPLNSFVLPSIQLPQHNSVARTLFADSAHFSSTDTATTPAVDWDSAPQTPTQSPAAADSPSAILATQIAVLDLNDMDAESPVSSSPVDSASDDDSALRARFELYCAAHPELTEATLGRRLSVRRAALRQWRSGSADYLVLRAVQDFLHKEASASVLNQQVREKVQSLMKQQQWTVEWLAKQIHKHVATVRSWLADQHADPAVVCALVHKFLQDQGLM
eukprot:TRINITY_DN9913_c0_g1_i1.p1 TRINITY_DN9913_c0_g1~~TRINITY_DN9913_c0_g1_i1.p1  ORF type:complete len:818 (+),score=157.61 TRINITY_DN9913_c0_g1_i1:35-2488(+)